MKTVSMRSLQQQVRKSVIQAQVEPIVVTKHGKPAAVVVGVDGLDWETLVKQFDLGFWKMIENRRKEKAVDEKQALKLLGLAPKRKKVKST